MDNEGKLFLITNVSFIEIERGLRLDAKALMIEQPHEDQVLGKRPALLLGFGVVGALPVFKMWLKGDASFELTDTHDPSKIMLTHDGEAKPIFSGALLKIDGHEFFIQAEDHDKPFAVDEFDPNVPDLYDTLWEKLASRVAEHWGAPYMPVPEWKPADLVRRGLIRQVV